MKQLGYLVVAALVIAIAAWLVVRGDDRPESPVDNAIVGVYRIADARTGPPDELEAMPALVGRAFIVRHDGPELIAGLCPDEDTCRRWLDETPAFRHSLASLPVTSSFADADAEALLASAHPIAPATATTITTEDGRCRRRVDAGSLTTSEVGLRLRRDLSQTELVTDCEAQPTSDRVAIELSLVRLGMD